MATVLTKTSDNTYKVELGEPEQGWVNMVAKALSQSDVTIMSIALSNGLLDLMCKFVRTGIDTEPKDGDGG